MVAHRKEFSPQDHGFVKALVLAEWPIEKIAKQLKCDKKTLHRAFAEELSGYAGQERAEKKFTDQQRGEVRGLAIANIPLDQIAKFVGISEPTLRKHFPEEIAKGRMTLLAGAATNMARMALGSKAEYDAKGHCIRAEVKPEFVACCYVLKTQGKDFGWSERLEHSGTNGNAIPLRIGSLSDAQLVQLLDRLEKSPTGQGD